MKAFTKSILGRAVVSAAILLASCAGVSKRAPSSDRVGALTAPPKGAEVIFDEDFPDPTVVRAADGLYYAYSTQTHDERSFQLFNLPVIVSDDLRHWKRIGDSLPVKPLWASVTQDFWAPHIVMKSPARYLLYYSAKPNLSEGLCLGVATASNPKGPFTDSGQPLVCGSSFENIDPMAFHDPVSQKDYLYWGSGFAPLKVQPLSADGLSFEPGSQATALVYPVKPVPGVPSSQTSYRKLVEGSWTAYHDGSYYLFFSGDNCCGPDAHYGVMVAKSSSPTGPFQFLQPNGEPEAILESFGHFKAPGHNALIDDSSGQTWILFHAIDETNPVMPTQIPGDRTSRRVLMRAKLNWTAARPTVEL